jgi:GNAT superfamily N-acetyltransferase
VTGEFDIGLAAPAGLGGPTASAADDTPVHARPYRARDESGVVELLGECFGQWPRGLAGLSPLGFFRWKHLNGRFGASTMVVAEADREIVGFIGYMPWLFTASGRIVQGMRGTDFAVHPAVRRRGVSMAMRAAAQLPAGAAFTWSNPNRESQAGGRNWGQREVSRLTQYVRAQRPQRRALCGVRTRTRAPRGELEADAETAGEMLRGKVGESLVLASAEASAQRLSTVRDVAYLRWRYGQFDDYRAVAAGSGSGDGLAVFRAKPHGRLWVTHIYELIATGDDHRVIRQLLRRVREGAQTDLITCNFASRPVAAANGFVPYPGRKFLMVLPLQVGIAPDPTRRDSWSLSLGDLDLL